MAIAVLDINDCELKLWQQDQLVLASPGYALLDGNDYRFGLDARDQARLHPRNINHRFWWQLNTEPLQPSFGPGRHTADLVHGHLQAIYEQGQRPEQLILAVPGSMQSEQLSLLLGIVGQCPFDIVGLVDRAICAGASTPLEQQSLHLDLQLHQAVLTQVELVDGHAHRHATTPIPGGGWLAVQDTICNAIADAFIKQTRFDPRRKADTEQLLYDQLPDILRQVEQQGEYNLELSGHRARLEYTLLTEACKNHCQRIVGTLTDTQAQLLVDARLALLPGLLQQLPGAEVLAADATAQTILQHQDAIVCKPDDIRFITRLPAREKLAAVTAEPAPVEPSAAEPTASHSTIEFTIDFKNGHYQLVPGSGSPPTINGSPVLSRQQLLPGDTLQVADGPALLIQEANQDDGSKT
jgi:hypothetical protein